MPIMSQASSEHRLVKLLLVGDGKLGKTWYAGMAAKAGFNVLYMDGDVGSQTLSQLPIEAQQRIFLMDVCDSLVGGRKDAKFLETLTEFATSVVFRWNDDEQRMAKKSDSANVWEIRPAKMDYNSVLVIDSWTGLTESIMTAAGIAHGVDLANASTAEMRPVYQSAGLKATQMLQLIRSLRCHVIVIGHPDEYSHMTKPDGRRVKDIKETDLVVDWTKMIPKSTSKPHGLQMAKYFTDVAWMETNATGSQRLLNFKLSDGRVSGGHFADRKDAATDYSFESLVKQLGADAPGDAGASYESWLNMIVQEGQNMVPTPAKVLDGTEAKLIQGASPTGMSSLFKVKPSAEKAS